MYVADLNNHRVQYFTPTGEFLGTWGSRGSGDGQFNNPNDVAVVPDGTVYVSDASTKRIQDFDATNAFIGEWGNTGGVGEFQSPHGVEASAAGTIYVIDSANHHVQYFLLPVTFLAARPANAHALVRIQRACVVGGEPQHERTSLSGTRAQEIRRSGARRERGPLVGE